jgi:ParB/RepB/Spo0J family partition protein
MSAQKFQLLALNDIVPSKDNARKIDQKSPDFQELVNSIRAGGVRVPIHIREHPTRKGKYEIRAGERRWRASKSAGMETIPAILHSDMTELGAFDLTFVENKFRQDLKPLEEVAEIGRYMDRLGNNAKLIAEKIGQTEQWVRLRANIHMNLHLAWRNAFVTQDYLADWTVGHLVQIARLPAKIQVQTLNEIKSQQWRWSGISIKDLKERIGGILNLLSRAKWSLEDETLVPKAGACSKCPKRSGAEPLLWFESVTEQIKTKDRCLDPLCWEEKLRSYLQQRAKKFADEHDNLIYVTTESPHRETAEYLSKKFGRVLEDYNYKKSNKKAKGSVPALIVHGKSAGNLIWVIENKIAGPAGAKRTGKPTPLKERRILLNAKRWAQVLRDLREKVEAAEVDSLSYKDKITGVMALAAFYGNERLWNANVKSNQDEIAKLVKKKDSSAALGYLWGSVKPTLDNLLTYNGPVTQTPEQYVKEAKWIAELIKVDLEAMFKAVSQLKGFTEPKSWKNLNADGTPKAKKKKKN